MKFKNKCYRRRPRGTVMVLVVAVLGLLAVIGTVYILSSRTERNSATAMSATINLDLARDAVNSQIQQLIGRPIIDGNNQIGGYGVVGTKLASRNFDYPETGTTFGQTAYNGNIKDEPWLVAGLHLPASASSPFDCSQLQGKLYNPSTGNNDLNLPLTYGTQMFNVVFDQTNTVTSQDTTPDKPDTTSGHPADSFVYLLPFSDASGIRYRYGVRILDTNRMANLNTGDVNDADALADTTGKYFTSIRLAPDPTTAPLYLGTNYYNSADGKDVLGSPIANMQYNAQGTGRVSSATSPNKDATAVTSANWQFQMLRIEKPQDQYLSLFDLSDELELRSYGEFGTPFHIRLSAQSPSTGATSAIMPATLSVDKSVSPTATPSSTVIGNPRRRNYTAYSFSRELRPYADPPLTGAGNRFTLTIDTPPMTPSKFSLDFNTPPASVAPGTPAQVWPTVANGALPRVSINPTLSAPDISAQSFSVPSQTNFDSMYASAMAATNIATAMERIAGFRHDEACGFAANYITSLWSGYTPDANISSVVAYYLPSGPSFVDAQGICVRTSVNSPPTPIGAAFTNASDLNTTTGGATNLFPGKIMVGYSAQPFIWEIAAQSFADGSGHNPAITDMAVVLYNPYSINLSMNGYHLTSQATNINIDLTTDGTNNLYVPAKGFLIITTDGSLAANGAKLVTINTGGNIVVARYNPGNAANFGNGGNVGFSLAGDKLTLRRNIIPRSGVGTLAVGVDDANYPGAVPGGQGSFFADPTATNPTEYDASITRVDPTDETSMAPQMPQPMNPAVINPPTAPAAGLPKYLPLDRDIQAAGPPLPQAPITNIADFNRIMRICNVVDTSGNPVPGVTGTTPAGLLTERFTNLGNGPDFTPSSPASAPGQLSNTKEAILYFDFFPNPKLYATPAEYPLAINPTGTNGATAFPCPQYNTDTDCDLRAVTLLDCLAIIDRVSDYSIDIGNSNPDINKLRIPGRININTASGDVLRAIPNMTDQMVADILYYRTLVLSGYGSVSAPTPALVSYLTSAGITTPRGYHSLAELLVPLATATGVINPDPTTGTNSLDKAWASVYNLCTVNSDTFVLYGYLEAVRQNPLYTGPTFDNAGMWYGTTATTSYTDDPHDANIANIPLLRVARRRWVAIIDRSWSNTAQTIVPRIVAIKDLPQ